jgi:hypothetical protein
MTIAKGGISFQIADKCIQSLMINNRERPDIFKDFGSEYKNQFS